MFIKTAKPL